MSKLSSDIVVDNFISMLSKYLKSELPAEGKHWELVEQIHTLTVNKLLHISQALEQGKGKV